jgi:hypothetical protein
MEQTLTAGNGLESVEPRGLNLSMISQYGGNQTIEPDVFKSEVVESGKYNILTLDMFKGYLEDVQEEISNSEQPEELLKALNEELSNVQVAVVGDKQFFLKAKEDVSDGTKKTAHDMFPTHVKNSKMYKHSKEDVEDMKNYGMSDESNKFFKKHLGKNGFYNQNTDSIENERQRQAHEKSIKYVTKYGKKIGELKSKHDPETVAYQSPIGKHIIEWTDNGPAHSYMPNEQKVQKSIDNDLEKAGVKSTVSKQGYNVYPKGTKVKVQMGTKQEPDIKEATYHGVNYGGSNEQPTESHSVTINGETKTVHGSRISPMLKLKKGEDNDLIKGDVTEAFMYSDNLKFDKTGEELKTKIDEAIVDEQAKVIANKAAVVAAMKVITDNYDDEATPTQPVDDWNFKGYKRKLQDEAIPKMFNWRETCYSDGKSDMAMPMGGVGEVYKNAGSKEEADAKDKYNNAVRSLVDSLVEVKTLSTIKNGLNDKQKYSLTQRQLSALGF